MEYLLQFEDLETVNEDGYPLLWECARWKMVTETMANRLRHQLGVRWNGSLPLDEGDKQCQNWFKNWFKVQY